MKAVFIGFCIRSEKPLTTVALSSHFTPTESQVDPKLEKHISFMKYRLLMYIRRIERKLNKVGNSIVLQTVNVYKSGSS